MAIMSFMLVASALAVRLTRFTHPHFSMPRQIVYRRPGGKLYVGPSAPHAPLRTDGARLPCKSANAYAATPYTKFATWAADTIRCREPVYRNLKWVRRTFEALATHANKEVAV